VSVVDSIEAFKALTKPCAAPPLSK